MTLARAASVLFDGMLVAAVGWGVFTAVQWPFETRLFPLTIGIPVLIVALGQLGRDIHRQLRQRADEPSPREEILDISVDTSVPAADVARRAGGFFGSALGLFGLILLVGFKVAIPVFLVVYLRFYSRASWRSHSDHRGRLHPLPRGSPRACLSGSRTHGLHERRRARDIRQGDELGFQAGRAGSET